MPSRSHCNCSAIAVIVAPAVAPLAQCLVLAIARLRAAIAAWYAIARSAPVSSEPGSNDSKVSKWDISKL